MNVPAVLLFIAGLGFGALFARVGLVVPVKQSLVRPIACCPQCQKPLKIPVLFAKHDANYKGEGCSCRRSGERIMFLLLTLLAGALFALAYQLFWAKPPEFALAILLVLLSVTITVSDLLYARIPNVVLLGFVPFVVVLRFLWPPETWYSYLIGALFGFGLPFAMALFKPGSIGMGDVKLLGMLGLFLGWKKLLLALFLASALGMLIAVGLLAAQKATRKDELAFGPPLCAAALVVFFFYR